METIGLPKALKPDSAELGGGDVDGFTYHRSVKLSDNFLTDEKASGL